MTQARPVSDQVLTQALAAIRGAAFITTNITDTTAAIIKGLWANVNPYDAPQVTEFARRAGRIIIASQRAVANANTAAQLLQLRAVGINQPVTVTIPDDVRGATVTFGNTPIIHAATDMVVDYSDGAQSIPTSDGTAGRIFERAAETYRYQRSIGKDGATANGMALDRIAGLVDDNMTLSARLSSQQTLKLVAQKDHRVTGYRRVIHPELSKGGVCGMCVAASHRKYFVSQLRPIHHHCKCTISPITTSHDPGSKINGNDLARLYGDASSVAPNQRATSAAALKRTRYQIVDHHELGPVLTPVKGETVPYYSTAPPVDLDAAATAASPS